MDSGLELQEVSNSDVHLYHKLVQEVQDYAIILLDINGIILNWNPGVEKIEQYKEQDIVGKNFQVLYHPDDREAQLPQRLLQKAFLEGRAEHEGWRIRKDQSKFWGSITLTALHDEGNKVIGFSNVTRDLTEKKLAEDQLKNYAAELKTANDELRKSHEQFQGMILEVQDYAIIRLNRNGDIESWNAGAESIKGYSAQEIIGRNFRIFYTQQDRDNDLPAQLLHQATQTGKALHEGWRVRKDGSKFWGSISITALHDDEGSIIGFSKVTRDLTERKLGEDRQQEYMHTLESQNSELEQFAYIASHDLQEPLRKIRTFASIMRKENNSRDQLEMYAVKIENAAARMSTLIKSVLNYSKLSYNRDDLVDTHLNLLMSDVKEEFELLIREKQAIVEWETLPVIKALPDRIRQLFINLIGNALKFSTEVPFIRVSSRLIPKDELLPRISNLPDNQYVEISVADNGIGFDQKYENLIFSMFQRLNSTQKFSGSGIGLALCLKIMKVHQGFITATGEVGKGATFRLYFPLE